MYLEQILKKFFLVEICLMYFFFFKKKKVRTWFSTIKNRKLFLNIITYQILIFLIFFVEL